jgi:hypothetical protein
MSNAADLTTFKKRDAWICRVMGEPSLTMGVRLIAVRLGHHHNCANGRCDPRLQAIAKELCISRRSVIRGIATLERRGWIVVERNVSGTHAGNQFDFLDPPTGDNPLSPVGVTTACHPSPLRRVTNPTGTGDKPGKGRVTYAVTPNNCEENCEENCEGKNQTPPQRDNSKTGEAATLFNDVTPDSSSRSRARRKIRKASAITNDTALDAAFDRFWLAYPRRVKRAKARKAFAGAIGAGADAERVIEAAHRYTAERAGEDPQYTAHPATWLHDERWLDEQPARSNGAAVTIDNETGEPIIETHPESDRRYRNSAGPTTFSEIAARLEAEREREEEEEGKRE